MNRVLGRILLATAVSLPACGGADRAGDAAVPRGGAMSVAASIATDTLGPSGRTQTDLGRGVLFLRDWPGGVASDSIIVFDRDSGDMLAFMVREVFGGHGWSWRVEQPAGGSAAVDNLLEYAYELSGLPFDSLNPVAGMARVIYGFDADGEPQRGWVQLQPGLAYLSWAEHLPAQSLFFLPAEDVRFHTQPGGSLIDMPIADSDYEMMADSVAGDWLRVRVTAPHGCTGEAVQHEATAWIRYLGAAGRPRVWYYARGC